MHVSWEPLQQGGRGQGPGFPPSAAGRMLGCPAVRAAAAASRDEIREMIMVPSRLRLLLAGYPELIAVLAAATLGLSVQPPLAWLAARQGINTLLAVLVFATAVTIDPAALRRLATAWRSLLAAVFAGITVLPALSWAVSRIVAAGSLRDGIMTIGLAPCEIASVATTAMAGGEAALSAGVLISSTVTAVAAAGPILILEAGYASLRPGHIIASLALVVALPLAAGIVLRARTPFGDHAGRAASITAVFSVAALVALIAAEVRLSARYLAVVLALIMFLAASALAGRVLSAGARRPAGVALLLTTSMRDFAIAAGLATAAFGPAAAAPLGLYGILVLVWGTAAAGVLRRRDPDRIPAAPRGQGPASPRSWTIDSRFSGRRPPVPSSPIWSGHATRGGRSKPIAP
jgi:predicted Na+-dependent transporter